MSIRMKSISVALVFFVVFASVLAAAPPSVQAASYGPSPGQAVLITVGFLVGLLALVGWMANDLSKDINEAMSTWPGHTFDELVMMWGPPSYVGELPSGNYVVGYTEVDTYYSPSRSRTNVQVNPFLNSATATTTTTPGAVTQYENYRMFYVNADGIITSWSWKGVTMDTPSAP